MFIFLIIATPIQSYLLTGQAGSHKDARKLLGWEAGKLEGSEKNS